MHCAEAARHTNRRLHRELAKKGGRIALDSHSDANKSALLALFRLVGRLPLPLLHALGVLLGWVAYVADPVYRRRLRANLQAAGVARGPGELSALRRQAIGHAGRTLAELPYLWFRPQAALARRVRVRRGQDALDAAQAAGRGILFLTPHLGAFECTVQWYGLSEPITVMYRRPKLAWLDPVLRAGRARGQVQLVGADLRGVRAMLRELRAGRAVGLLPDQAPGAGEGVWAPFFGRPAWTMTLAARLAQAAGASVLMTTACRLPYARGFALEFDLLPSLPADAQAAALAINEAVEAVVRRHPGQYLWSYNRYKRPAGAPPPPVPADASRERPA